MPLDDTINDISALGGLPFFFIMAVLIILSTPATLRLAATLMLFLGLAACFAIVALIRFIWFKERPQPVEHKNLWQRIDASSFPSLHTMRAAFLGTVFIVLAKFSPWMIAAALLFTLAVAWARVRKKRHHVIDVVVGAILGIIVAVIALVLMVLAPTWF